MHSPKRLRKTQPVATFYAYTDEEARVYANAHRTSANVFAFYNALRAKWKYGTLSEVEFAQVEEIYEALHDYLGDEIDG